MKNNKFKIIVILLLTFILWIFIWWAMYLWMIQNPFIEKNDFFSRIEREQKLKNEEMEKKALQNFLNSSKADEIFKNTQEEEKSFDYWTWNWRFEALFSDYDSFWMNETTINSYANLSTSDIEALLNSENQKAKEEFTKATVDLRKFLEENITYHNWSMVYEWLEWKAEVNRLYAREYYNHIKNVVNSNNKELIELSKASLEDIKSIIVLLYFKSSSEERSYKQITVNKDWTYDYKIVIFKSDLQKITVDYWENNK